MVARRGAEQQGISATFHPTSMQLQFIRDVVRRIFAGALLGERSCAARRRNNSGCPRDAHERRKRKRFPRRLARRNAVRVSNNSLVGKPNNRYYFALPTPTSVGSFEARLCPRSRVARNFAPVPHHFQLEKTKVTLRQLYYMYGALDFLRCIEWHAS